MLDTACREAIARLWARKLDQDARKLPKAQRHRNLHPATAEFVCALATGLESRNLVDVGGSSGISTIALAAAARTTNGRVVSIEIEPARQAEARATLAELGLDAVTRFVLDDAARVLPALEPADFVMLDCEKDDYVGFFDLLRLARGAVVVADNVLSHGLTEYVAHVRRRSGAESVTLPIGKGIEVTRLP
jgi:predicted O-methyltransferase YrrM